MTDIELIQLVIDLSVNAVLTGVVLGLAIAILRKGS